MRGLPHDRAARTHERERSRHARGRAGGFDDEVERARRAGAALAPEQRDLRPRGPEHARRRASRAFRAPRTAARVPGPTATWSRISQAAASGSMKTASSSAIARGHLVEVRHRKRQPLRVRARRGRGCRGPALRAVRPRPSRAPSQRPQARLISPTTRFPRSGEAGGPLDDADELVAGDAGEAVVAAAKLEVRVADAREEDAHEREALPRRGPPHVADGGPALLEEQRQRAPIVPGVGHGAGLRR